MKIKVWLSIGITDLEDVLSPDDLEDVLSPDELGLTNTRWESLSPYQKSKIIREWALDKVEYGYEEIE